MMYSKLKFIFLSLMLTASISCTHSQDRNQTQNASLENTAISGETAYFASGCFWCVEAVFESVKGVKEAISGYAGGSMKNPTYNQVSRGETNHAEAVKVIYDAEKIDFKTLLTVFFDSQDPTTLNRQGPDRGTQYRSIAFYQNEKEKAIIEGFIDSLNTNEVYTKPVVTQVEKYTKFWPAEDYHQDYEEKNPNNPYIRNVSVPRINRFQEKHPELLKDNH